MASLPTDDGLERLCMRAAPGVIWSVVSFDRAAGWHYDIEGNNAGFGYGPPCADRPMDARQAVAARDAIVKVVCERYQALRPRHQGCRGNFDVRVYYSADGELRDAYFSSLSGGTRDA